MTHYTDEKQAQIVIALLKAHDIRNVIASPGTTNMAFVGSVQKDPFFSVYSAVDERSAAYMACGLAEETGRPVVLSCTGATASRNYMAGLTEAFYRKLPVLALTSMQGEARGGHLIAQVIDRSSMPVDVLKLSVDLPIVRDPEQIWECEMKVNRAILELTRHGGGPAHINLPTTYSRNFTVKELPTYRKIDRWTPGEVLPGLTGKVAVFVGAHKRWNAQETAMVERFCEVNNAAVFCDHSSGYYGKYRVQTALIGGQEEANHDAIRPDVLIHVGEISGDYESHRLPRKSVWRVSPDGEIRDTFRRLRHVFEMPEQEFFKLYSTGATGKTDYYEACQKSLAAKQAIIPELPFSNLWIASQFSKQVPKGSVVHFAILNSLRAWNFFELPAGVRTASNTGGFGIDGCMSTLIGAALADPDRLYFLVTGDLAFFYDMNVLGNRHLGKNVRILLVNNGKGTEFTQHNHAGSYFGKDADSFIAADGHFGQMSPDLVSGYAQALGLEYVAFRGKQESEEIAALLFSPELQSSPILVEAFVDAEDESNALKMIKNLETNRRRDIKRLAKNIIGPAGVQTVKHALKK